MKVFSRGNFNTNLGASHKSMLESIHSVIGTTFFAQKQMMP